MKTDYREEELDMILKTAELLQSFGKLEVESYKHPLEGDKTFIKVGDKTIDIAGVLSIDFNFFTNTVLICTNTIYGNVCIAQFMDKGSVINNV